MFNIIQKCQILQNPDRINIFILLFLFFNRKKNKKSAKQQQQETRDSGDDGDYENGDYDEEYDQQYNDRPESGVDYVDMEQFMLFLSNHIFFYNY